jgi:hypothetical protein
LASYTNCCLAFLESVVEGIEREVLSVFDTESPLVDEDASLPDGGVGRGGNDVSDFVSGSKDSVSSK